MTSFAFILGVFTLAVVPGAGAEMRQSFGTAVFSGMLGVTVFGLLFTPTLYMLVRKMKKKTTKTTTLPPAGVAHKQGSAEIEATTT